jgi:23S rRNA (guanosine2251-2'-O)-methyltransferase
MRGGPPYPVRRPVNESFEGIAPAGDEELVAGRRPVEEAFVARREARRLLVVPQRRMALEKLVLHATSLRIPVVEVEGGSLTAIAGFDGHQGIALVVAPRRWAALDDILALATQRDQAPLVLVLDSLEDPQNVGTLLRTAEAQGAHGAVFPTRHQAPLTPAAVKASAGAVEHLQLAPVDDLAAALADLHVRGLRIVGADGDAPLTAREADLRGPVAIVVGSEGKGLGPAVRRRCDLLVRIPMRGRIESLNAAVAGSILLYEAAAQRGLAEVEPGPSAEDDATGVDLAPDGGTEVEPGASSGDAAPADDSVAAHDAGAPPADPPSAGDADGDTASEPEAPGTEPEAPGAPKPPRTRARTRSAPAGGAPAAPPVADDDLLPGGPAVELPGRAPVAGEAARGDVAPSDAAEGQQDGAASAVPAASDQAPGAAPEPPAEV